MNKENSKEEAIIDMLLGNDTPGARDLKAAIDRDIEIAQTYREMDARVAQAKEDFEKNPPESEVGDDRRPKKNLKMRKLKLPRVKRQKK